MSPDGHHRLGAGPGGSLLLPASVDMQRAASGRLPLSSALSASRAASGRLPLSAAAGASRATTSSGRLPTVPSPAALKASRCSPAVAADGGGGRTGSGDAPGAGAGDNDDSSSAAALAFPAATPQLAVRDSAAESAAAPVRTAGFRLQDGSIGGVRKGKGAGGDRGTRGGGPTARGFSARAARPPQEAGSVEGGSGYGGRGRSAASSNGANPTMAHPACAAGHSCAHRQSFSACATRQLAEHLLHEAF